VLHLDAIEREIDEAEELFAAERLALKVRIEELAAAEVELLTAAPARYNAERQKIEAAAADLARREGAVVAEFERRVCAIRAGLAVQTPPSGKLSG
jgi:hypothetical protein